MGIGKTDFLGSVSICIFPSCCSFSTDPAVATLSGNPFSRTAFFLTLRVQLQKFYFKNSVHIASFCVWAKNRAGRSSWLVWVNRDGERRQTLNSMQGWLTSMRLFVCLFFNMARIYALKYSSVIRKLETRSYIWKWQPTREQETWPWTPGNVNRKTRVFFPTSQTFCAVLRPLQYKCISKQSYVFKGDN